MNSIDRRSLIALGITAAAVPLGVGSGAAQARTYGPDEGKELFPGVRAVELGKRDSNISAFKTLEMVDVVFQPGADFPVGEAMEHDMVCQVTTGELQVKAGDQEFAAKDGDVWSCGKDSTKEGATNKGSEIAVMRVIYLKT